MINETLLNRAECDGTPQQELISYSREARAQFSEAHACSAQKYPNKFQTGEAPYTFFGRSLDLLAPWGYVRKKGNKALPRAPSELPPYPGRHALWRTLFAPRNVTPAEVRQWRSGRRPAPSWAVDLIAAECERRGHALFVNAAALRAEIAARPIKHRAKQPK